MKFHRRIIQITAEHSPNVRFARMQEEQGIEPDDRQIFPGVLTWSEYKKRRATWDEPRQHVGLDAKFYTGKDALLFPPLWLDHSHDKAADLVKRRVRRIARAMGIDPAEGGDMTSYAIIDEHGLIALFSLKTPDTEDVYHHAVRLMHQFKVPPENILFDRGGGGKQHADRMINAGYPVRSMGFGEAVGPELTLATKSLKRRRDEQGQRYVYKNRRAEMYWNLSYRMDPKNEYEGFAIPAGEEELRRQLAPFPRKYERERIYLPPKDRKPGSQSKEPTLKEILGRSPDDADALVLAVYAMTHQVLRSRVGMAS